ncbi:MAG: hydrogenase maturation protease [Acidobacteria bacterium]|nr:hydrogenase maturation protease [Acidobacteriota bacterium]
MKGPALADILRVRPLLLLGVGNPLRGDDAIGHALAEALEPESGGGFRARPVGVSIEGALGWVREEAGGTVLVADAVYDEDLPEGEWELYPPERLDSVCHTAHSIPMSLLFAFWKNEVPGLGIHFLGIGIRSSEELAPLSPRLQITLESLTALCRAALGPR